MDDVERDLPFECVDGIARITFNRPQARNALTFAMYDRLVELCARLDADRSARVLVLTGAGGRAFASGTDIAQFRGVRTPEDALEYEARVERALSALERVGVPTVAAIAGACTGGGAAIAACCDLRVAAPNLRFGFPMARTLGNCLTVTNCARLAALVGAARASEMILTARLVEAPEALAAGLLTEVAADEAALPERADALARLLAGNAPLTLRVTREAMRRVRERMDPGGGDDLIRLCYGSRDFREGMEAFLAKRPPEWRGE